MTVEDADTRAFICDASVTITTQGGGVSILVAETGFDPCLYAAYGDRGVSLLTVEKHGYVAATREVVLHRDGCDPADFGQHVSLVLERSSPGG